MESFLLIFRLRKNRLHKRRPGSGGSISSCSIDAAEMDGDPSGSRGESQCLFSLPQDGGPPLSPMIRAWPLWAVRRTSEMLQPQRPQGPSTTGLMLIPATCFPSQLLPPQLGSNSPESLPPFPCHPCLAVPSAVKPEQTTLLYAHHGQAGRHWAAGCRWMWMVPRTPTRSGFPILASALLSPLLRASAQRSEREGVGGCLLPHAPASAPTSSLSWSS